MTRGKDWVVRYSPSCLAPGESGRFGSALALYARAPGKKYMPCKCISQGVRKIIKKKKDAKEKVRPVLGCRFVNVCQMSSEGGIYCCYLPKWLMASLPLGLNQYVLSWGWFLLCGLFKYNKWSYTVPGHSLCDNRKFTVLS